MHHTSMKLEGGGGEWGLEKLKYDNDLSLLHLRRKLQTNATFELLNFLV